MLIAIVLDKPLAETQKLVQDSDAFMRAITQIMQDEHSYPVTAQMQTQMSCPLNVQPAL